MKGRKVMSQFLLMRKAFLLTTLVFVLDFVFGTAVALALSLSDPAIGSARNNWFANGTPLSAPGIFMVLYGVFLLLATRQRWIGTIGIVGITLLTLISGVASIADMNITQRVFEYHLTLLTALPLVVAFVTIPIVIILGILTLMLQVRARTHPAIS
jgi:hypothetical protein